MDWLISYPEDFGHGTSADLEQNHKVIATDSTDTVGIAADLKDPAVVATELVAVTAAVVAIATDSMDPTTLEPQLNSGLPPPRSSGELIISGYQVQVFIDKSALKTVQFQNRNGVHIKIGIS